MCVTRANESFNDITKKNKMKALENKYIHIKYMYKVIQFVKSNAFFFFVCFRLYHRDSRQEFAKVGGIFPILHVVFLLDTSN